MKSSNIIILSVKGETGKYTVDWNIYKGWICDCPDHFFRKSFCKHIQACRNYVIEHGLLLHGKLWVDDPKADMEFNNAETEVVI